MKIDFLKYFPHLQKFPINLLPAIQWVSLQRGLHIGSFHGLSIVVAESFAPQFVLLIRNPFRNPFPN